MSFVRESYRCKDCGEKRRAWVESLVYKEKLCPACLDQRGLGVPLLPRATNHLHRYARSITVGLHGELSAAHKQWKEALILADPEGASMYRSRFRRLENPKNWEELFRAMNSLGFTQSDVHEHCEELKTKGEQALAEAVLDAAQSTASVAFELMEMG